MFPFPFSFLSTQETGLDLLDNVYSMSFDGSNEIVTNFLASGQTKISVSAWIKLPSIGSDHCIFGTVWAGSTAFTFDVGSNGKLRIFYRSGGGNPGFLFANTTLSANTWYHAVVTLTPNSSNMDCTFYLNGSIDNTTGATQAYGQGQTAIASSGFPYNIGSTGNTFASSYNYFNGKIDEVAIFNYAIESSDVEDIYNATNDNTGKTADLSSMATPPIAWYRMGD